MDRHKSLNRRCGAVANRACAALVLLLACASCRTLDQTQVELLERELRRQETYIYELEDYLLAYSEKLNQCRRNHAAERALSCDPVPAETSRAGKSTQSIPEPELADDPPRASKGSKPRPAKANGSLAPAPGAEPQATPPSTTGPSTTGPSERLPDMSNAGPSTAGPSTGVGSAPAADSSSDSAFPSADEPASPESPTTPENPTSPENDSPETLEAEPLEIGWRAEDEAEVAAAARGARPLAAQPTATPRRPLSARLHIPDAAHYVDDETPIDQHDDREATQALMAEADVPHDEFVIVAAMNEEVDASAVEASPAGAAIVQDPIDDVPANGVPGNDVPANDALANDADIVDAARLPHSIDIRRMIVGDAQAMQEPSLLVVVETLNARQEPLEPNGQVSLMAMTSDAPGSWTRIQRWDFTSDEAASSWQSTALGDGFHLQLPLALESLPEKPLELWARVVFKDGSKMLTKRPLDVRSLPSLDDALASADQIAHAPSPRPPAQLVPAERDPSPATNSEAQSSSATGDSASGASADPHVSASEWRPATRPISPRVSPGRRAAPAGLDGTRPERPAAWSVRSEPIPRRRPSAENRVQPPVPQLRAGALPAPRWQPYR